MGTCVRDRRTFWYGTDLDKHQVELLWRYSTPVVLHTLHKLSTLTMALMKAANPEWIPKGCARPGEKERLGFEEEKREKTTYQVFDHTIGFLDLSNGIHAR